MIERPRLGLCIPDAGPEPSFAGLALLAGLSSLQFNVQHFRCRACPTETEVVAQLTGRPGRHLDAWLMPEDVCRRNFVKGTCGANLAVVEGTVAPARPWVSFDDLCHPGQITPIAESLSLPKVGVIRCPTWENLHLPYLHEGVDAFLIDELERPEDFDAIVRLIGLVTKKPVIGAVEQLPGLRALLRESPRGALLSADAVDALAGSFRKFLNLRVLRNLTSSRAFPDCGCGDSPCLEPKSKFRVAYASDEIFGGYFPDTLETLEALGADLEPFSPLRHGSLPSGVDLVLIGCGLPELDPEALSANSCLFAELRSHVCQGRRIYAEGGGAAYLGHSYKIAGTVYPGAGLLPFQAELLENPRMPYPVSRTFLRDVWLGRQGTEVRGYQSGRWRVEPRRIESHCDSCFGALSADRDMWFHHHVVGSLIHLHLASLPQVVEAFAGPHSPSLTLPIVRA